MFCLKLPELSPQEIRKRLVEHNLTGSFEPFNDVPKSQWINVMYPTILNIKQLNVELYIETGKLEFYEQDQAPHSELR